MHDIQETGSIHIDMLSSTTDMPSSTTSHHSDTSSEDSSSTYRYSHEPWDSFQNRVSQLASQLFPDANVRDIQIQRMRGGGSNRVIGVGIPDLDSGGLLSHISWSYERLRTVFGFTGRPPTTNIAQYILRVPRWGSEFMPRNIATTKFASSKLSVPIPTTVSHDLLEGSALGAPYELQHRLPGQNLQAVFSQLNMAQRKDLTRKICEIILDIQKSTFDTCAIIGGITSGTSQFEMNLLPVPADPDNEGNSNSPPADQGSGTLDFIISTCKRWKDYEATYLQEPNPEWDQCTNMAQEMYDHGLLPHEDQFHFTHLDLYPRNILINIADSESIEITGILDWDDALFAPRFMACRAPFWLWEGEEEVDEGDEYEALKAPQDADLEELKALFEETAGPEFCKYAYGEEYILLRRMFHILRFGLGYSHHFPEIEYILARWQELRGQYTSVS